MFTKACKCGSMDLHVDDWMPATKPGPEIFVRCRNCQSPGPSAYTEDEAVNLWNAQAA